MCIMIISDYMVAIAMNTTPCISELVTYYLTAAVIINRVANFPFLLHCNNFVNLGSYRSHRCPCIVQMQDTGDNGGSTHHCVV